MTPKHAVLQLKICSLVAFYLLGFGCIHVSAQSTGGKKGGADQRTPTQQAKKKDAKPPAFYHFNETLGPALAQAVENDAVQEVKELLRKHANPNSLNAEQDTIMMVAVQHNNLEIVQLLYAAGANFSARGSADDSLGDTPLMAAVLLRHIAIAKFLLSKGAYVDQPDYIGDTPLMAVAGYGYAEEARLLLTYKANVNACTHAGATALMTAAANNQKSMVELLLQHNADVSLKNKWGQTALMLAESRNYPEIVALLKKKGSKPQ